jgi:CDP-diacylglycerol--glycerol-3-phosphate 3-phosphatidyltransferase
VTEAASGDRPGGAPVPPPVSPPVPADALVPAPEVAGPEVAVVALRPVPLVNVANVLTAVRLVMVPVFVWVVVATSLTGTWWRVLACAIFCLASATDFADGYLARSRQLVTPFGKVADPIADKALTGTALVLLSVYAGLPWWVTALILVREIGITGLRFWVLRHGVIAASRGGKLKTVLQIVGIAWYLLPWPHPLDVLGFWIMLAALLVTVVTGFDYVYRAFALRRRSLRERARARELDKKDPV